MNLNAALIALARLVRAVSLLLLFTAPMRAGETLQVSDVTDIARRPAAMALLSDGDRLAVVNANVGTLSLIDLNSQSVVGEWSIGKRPTGACSLPDNCLAVVDPRTDLLTILDCRTSPPSVIQQVTVPHSPVAVQSTRDGGILIVASQWSHRVSLWKRPLDGDEFSAVQTLKLDFPPGRIFLAPDESFAVIVDAFDGNVVALDLFTGKTCGRLSLDAHNIRGNAFSGDTLLLSHQIIHADVPTTADEIASGTVVENIHREIEVTRGLDGMVTFMPRSQREIGTPSEGAADPAGITVAANGERFVALSGINEVAILNELGSVRQRPDVGRHPTELLYDPRRDQVYVLNEFSDSVSVMQVNRRRATREIRLGDAPHDGEPALRGEELFHSGAVSRFGWMSCASCHPRGHMVHQRVDTFGDETSGAPKRVLSLLGGRDNNPWAWNGQQRNLHDQVFKSVQSTMHGPGLSARDVNSIVAYLHSLDPPPPVDIPADETDRRLIDQGRSVFLKQQCQRCHVPPLTYSSDGLFDVGLEDENGFRKFNPPSLIGVGHRRAFFHDMRAESLGEVFVDHGHQLQEPLIDDELKALVRFLRSL